MKFNCELREQFLLNRMQWGIRAIINVVEWNLQCVIREIIIVLKLNTMWNQCKTLYKELKQTI